MNLKYNAQLHMTLHERNQRISDLLKSVSKRIRIFSRPCSFGTDSFEQFGRTYYNENTDVACLIEINTETHPNHLFEENGKICVSDFDFLAHINAVFHEESHAVQSMYTRDKPDELGKELTMSYIAEACSPAFRNDYYNYFPGEIYAECAALPKTYEYLQSEFVNQNLLSQEEADEILLDFVNELCRRDENYCLNMMKNDANLSMVYTSVNSLMQDVDLSSQNSCYYKLNSMDMKDSFCYDGLNKKDNRCLNRLPNMNDKTEFVSCLICQSMPELKEHFALFDRMNVDKALNHLRRKTENIFDVLGHDTANETKNDEFDK